MIECSLGWICGAIAVNALMSIFILDTLKDILKELKKK